MSEGPPKRKDSGQPSAVAPFFSRLRLILESPLPALAHAVDPPPLAQIPQEPPERGDEPAEVKPSPSQEAQVSSTENTTSSHLFQEIENVHESFCESIRGMAADPAHYKYLFADERLQFRSVCVGGADLIVGSITLDLLDSTAWSTATLKGLGVVVHGYVSGSINYLINVF